MLMNAPAKEHTTLPAEEHVTASDLRAAIARAGTPKYILAAKIRLHPVRLSKILNERETLTKDLALRVLRALKQE